MRRTIPIVLLVGVVLALAAVPAGAGLPQPYVVHDLVWKGCGFKVQLDVNGGWADRFWDEADGTARYLGTSAFGTTVTATNPKTGASVTVPYVGTLAMSWASDGSWTEAVDGPWVWQYLPPAETQAGLWYSTGHVAWAVDATGAVTSSSISAPFTDLCALLAR